MWNFRETQFKPYVGAGFAVHFLSEKLAARFKNGGIDSAVGLAKTLVGPGGSGPWSSQVQQLTQFAADLLGPAAVEAGGKWSYELLRARGNSIEGGTTEVLKNIVAERVLGLPKAR